MPPLRRKFSIDDYLTRHDKALGHLHDLDVFDEFKSYVTKYSLYDKALALYRYREEFIKGIFELYAQYLSRESKHKDAGIGSYMMQIFVIVIMVLILKAYEYLTDYSNASESYRLAQLWRESLSCATLIPLPPAQLEALARTIADCLTELKDYHSSANIYLDYLHDLETSTRMYCKGHHYADAIRILSLRNRSDLIDQIVDPCLGEGMAVITELLAECKSQINAQVLRIFELRIKKSDDPLAFFDGDLNGGADIPDNISLAATDASTTGGSLFTRYTNRTGTVDTNATRKTSKNRRREERKRARGKKGSVYEEEYLVNSCGRLIDRINSVGDEVQRLVMGLMRRGMRERAKAVEGTMIEVVNLCKRCVEEVFEREAVEDTVNGSINPRPKGPDGVLWDNQIETSKKKETPIVKDFERLTVLDG